MKSPVRAVLLCEGSMGSIFSQSHAEWDQEYPRRYQARLFYEPQLNMLVLLLSLDIKGKRNKTYPL